METKAAQLPQPGEADHFNGDPSKGDAFSYSMPYFFTAQGKASESAITTHSFAGRWYFSGWFSSHFPSTALICPFVASAGTQYPYGGALPCKITDVPCHTPAA